MENIQPVDSSTLDLIVSKYSPFLHEIRKRILITLAVFAAGAIIGFIYYEPIVKFLISILSLQGVNIVFTSPFQFINLSISCAFATGLLLVFPLIVYQFYSFLKPALRIKEFRMVVKLLPFSLILFIAGFLFGFLIMKWQIEIFQAKAASLGIGNVLDISHLLSTVMLTSAFMGLAFEFPIALLLLMRIGIVKPASLAKLRIWIYLGSFIFAILLPPDSILADILLTLPIVVMFEMSLIIYRVWGKS